MVEKGFSVPFCMSLMTGNVEKQCGMILFNAIMFMDEKVGKPVRKLVNMQECTTRCKLMEIKSSG